MDWYTDSILCLLTFMVFSLSVFIFQTLDRRRSIVFAEMCQLWSIFVPSAVNIIIFFFIDPCTTAFHWSYPKFDNFSTRWPILSLDPLLPLPLARSLICNFLLPFFYSLHCNILVVVICMLIGNWNSSFYIVWISFWYPLLKSFKKYKIILKDFLVSIDYTTITGIKTKDIYLVYKIGDYFFSPNDIFDGFVSLRISKLE